MGRIFDWGSSLTRERHPVLQPLQVRATAGAVGATGGGPRGGGRVDAGQPGHTHGAATPMAPGGSGGWSQISAWRLAVGGKDEPTMVPIRGGGEKELPPCHVPGARPGAPQTGLQVILAAGPGAHPSPSPRLRAAVCGAWGTQLGRGARVQTQPLVAPTPLLGGSRGCRGWWDE